MRITKWSLGFLFLSNLIINSDSFLPPRVLITKCPNRLFGLQLKLLKRKSSKEFKHRLNIIRKNQNEIVDQSVSVVSDNIVQDFIYVLKFYNLSDDSSSSFIYIIFYETLWLGFEYLKLVLEIMNLILIAKSRNCYFNSFILTLFYT